MTAPRNLKTHLIFMWLYVFVVYLSFFRHMITAHYIGEFSLSHIGWIIGDMRYLLGFLVLALPFCLYLILFLNKHFIGSNNYVRTISIISCASMVIGGLTPLREETTLFCFIHVFLSVGGAIALMISILAAFIIRASKSKQNVVILLLCGLYAVAIMVAFAILRTAAFFQLAVTLNFMFAMLISITVSVKQLFFIQTRKEMIMHIQQIDCR